MLFKQILFLKEQKNPLAEFHSEDTHAVECILPIVHANYNNEIYSHNLTGILSLNPENKYR